MNHLDRFSHYQSFGKVKEVYEHDYTMFGGHRTNTLIVPSSEEAKYDTYRINFEAVTFTRIGCELDLKWSRALARRESIRDHLGLSPEDFKVGRMPMKKYSAMRTKERDLYISQWDDTPRTMTKFDKIIASKLAECAQNEKV